MANVQQKDFTDFTGGLNLVDSELNMNPAYLTVAQNVELGYDSTIKKRNGFKLVKNIMPYLIAETATFNGVSHTLLSKNTTRCKWSGPYYTESDEEGETVYSDEAMTQSTGWTITATTSPEQIQEVFYFATYLFMYTNKGRVLSLDDENDVYIEYDEFEAAMVNASIWSECEERCYGAPADDMFILSNGYNKPLQICLNNNQREIVQTTITAKSSTSTTTTFTVAATGLTDKFVTGANIGVIDSDGTYLVGSCSSVTTNSITMAGTSSTIVVGDTIEIHQGASNVMPLHDPSTGGNANTPVIYKCVMVNHYLCAICLETQKYVNEEWVYVPDTTVHFSAKNSPGVWEGDSGWSEAGGADAIDIANLVRMDEQYLIDIDIVRGELCVFTNYAFILYKLDTYKDTTESEWDSEHSAFKTVTTSEHIPELDTIVENAGCITAGSVRSTYDSTAFLSTNGINSVKRNVISQNFVPESLSYKVLPYIKERMTDNFIVDGAVTLLDTRKFVYGLKFEDNTMLLMSFHPNLDGKNCFYTWTNIKYKSFTNNVYGRILTTDGYGVMMYSDDSEGICYDQYIDPYSGTAVDESYEMVATSPWLLYGKANNVKTMEYINVVADKTAQFTVSSMFDLQDENEIAIDMLGSDRDGYGSGYQADRGSDNDPYYGGGIIASNLNLIDFNQVFMYNKFKIRSTDKYPLRVIRVGVNYKVGGIRR